jgi:hypothetical protein
MVIVFFCVWVSFCIYLLWRNNRVYDERMRIVNRIFEMNDWKWRLRRYEAGPSYNEMMWKLWRPVNSFVTDPATWERPK